MLEEYGIAWEAEEAEEEETAAAEAAQGAEQAAEPPAEATAAAEALEAVKIEDSGRKSKHGEAVKQWRVEHPTGSKKGCARDLGVSLPTVRRHWQIDA